MGKDLPSTQVTRTREQTLDLMKPVSELLGPQASEENKRAIGFELDMLAVKLDLYGWGFDFADKDGDGGRSGKGYWAAIRERRTADWINVLGEYHVKAVRKAIGDYLEWRAREVKAGRALKNKFPTEHDINVFVQARRREALASAQRQPATVANEGANVTKISDETRAELNDMVRKMFPTNRN